MQQYYGSFIDRYVIMFRLWRTEHFSPHSSHFTRTIGLQSMRYHVPLHAFCQEIITAASAKNSLL